MEERGCGYCLRLWTDDIHTALTLLREHQLPKRKVYLQGRDGQLEEMML